MKDIGIVGLPQSGKTTLFNALTRVGAPAGGAAGKASVAAVPVPDPRVDVLAELERSRKRVFAQARFVDVAGLSVGAPGGGLAAQALGALRAAAWEPEDRRVLRNFAPLTLKPALAVLNVGEEAAGEAAELAERAEATLGLPTVALAAALEAEAAELAPGEAAALLAEYGVKRGGLDQVVGAAWRLLDLVTFLTTGEDESRAWEVRKGATAPEAAGRIHSDLQRGFIRAEVVGYDELVAAGGWDAAKAKGLLRAEGKSYVVREGDVLHVRFNV